MSNLISSILTKQECPECKNNNLITDHDSGETVCGNCGLVIQEKYLDTGPEWRSFNLQETKSRSRVGIPSQFSLHDKGLSTTINQTTHDAHGRKLPLKTRINMQRLKKWQIRSRVHSSIDRNLSQAMTELDRLSDKLSIPDSVKEKSALIYRKALNKGLVRGRSIAGIAAASIYVACRFSGTPRNLREISEKALVNRKEISRDYRLIVKELGILMPISRPTTYLTKIALRTNLSGEVQEYAKKILKEAIKKKVASGKDPTGLAAAALYIAAKMTGQKKTQKAIAASAGVTEVTVRNRYKTLRKNLHLNFD
jgi:transcription initiation factor TFIIB